jgi:hypothetical protein
MAKKARIEILIDPETLEYQLTIDYVKLKHIHAVCSDILRRIEANEFDRDDLIVGEEEGQDEGEDGADESATDILSLID